MYACALYVCLVPAELKRGCGILWKLEIQTVVSVTWVLRIEPRASARTGSALNC